MSGFSVLSKEPSIIWAGMKEINDRIDAKYFHYDYMTFNLNDYDKVKNLDQCVDFFETGVSNFNEGELRLKRLKTSNIQNNVVLYEDLIDCKIQKKDKRKILQKGDVVLTTYGTGSIGKTAYINSDTQIVPDYTIAILRTKSNLDSGYLMSFFSSSYGNQQVLRRVIGTSGITLVIKPHLKDIKIPIPSPEIQKYIGDKVRRAEELREEAKRLENEINTFFNEKFSDIYNSIDESKVYHSKFTWKSAENIRDVFNAEYFTLIGDKYEQVIREQKGVYLDDLLKDCFMGKSPSQYADKGPKILKVKNLTNGGLDWSDSDHVDKEFYVKNKRCHLQHGDVFIIPAAHLAKYIGEKVDVYIQGIEGIKYPDAMASGKIIVIRPNFDKVNPIYLCLVMREKFVYHQIQRQVSGITASYYPKDVRQLCIPLIEREKQDMVADKYIEIIKCKEQAKQLIQEAKQDVEDLIEGDFEMSELNNNSSTESRC